MAWRAQGKTGSNSIPLGNRRRMGGEGDENDYTPPQQQHQAPSFDHGLKRERGSSPPPMPMSDKPNGDVDRGRRKKRNRWGDATENKAAGLMGLPTAIMANMTSEQLEAYTLHLRIEEISQKLRIDDVVPADGDR